jgi:hypothetical protein
MLIAGLEQYIVLRSLFQLDSAGPYSRDVATNLPWFAYP